MWLSLGLTVNPNRLCSTSAGAGGCRYLTYPARRALCAMCQEKGGIYTITKDRHHLGWSNLKRVKCCYSTN